MNQALYELKDVYELEQTVKFKIFVNLLPPNSHTLLGKLSMTSATKIEENRQKKYQCV